jgi:AraC family transcriptional regulator of adaptative response/methylated-DNA-[protein]-cysteine methyltransferase
MISGSHYTLIEKAIYLLVKQAGSPSRLRELAQRFGLSEFHFHRLFLEWAGVTPKEFTQAITLERSKRLLGESRSLLSTAFDVGLSSTGRLHDLFVSLERMTPGEYKDQGKDLRIAWSMADTPFGSALFAGTKRGLCRLSFVPDAATAEQELNTHWPLSKKERNHKAVSEYVEEINRRMSGMAPSSRLGLLMKGSEIRIKVWQALLRIPSGCVVSYGEVARMAKHQAAVRAVASSVAQNPIAYLIPCHRVILANGIVGEYQWGSTRKLLMIGLERQRATGCGPTSNSGSRSATEEADGKHQKNQDSGPDRAERLSSNAPG